MAPRTTIIVTTVNEQGIINAAPFSFTMPISTDPPLLGVASVPSHHTYRNIQKTGEFVVNIPPMEILEQLWITSEKFPEEVNELEKAGLSTVESENVQPPGIKECIAQLECVLEYDKALGDHQLIIGKVVTVSTNDRSIKEGLLDVEEMRPILHLGGKDFVVGDHRKKVK
jgi:flavin reductase (DIM6/NTAB) family NADH-FMN oxidoreductase RutF